MFHRRSIALIGALVLLLLPVLTTGALARDPGSSANRARHDRVVAYWTAERIASARPRDMSIGRAPSTRREPTPVVTSTSTGDQTPPAATIGSQWPNGVGKVYTATGRVLFKMGDYHYVCSGAVATDADTRRSIVLTAAHCAFDQATRSFASYWVFMPEFDSRPDLWTCANTTHGCWTAESLVVHNGYAGQPGFDSTAKQHDWAFAVVRTGGHAGTRQLDTTVGSFPIAFTSYRAGTPVTAMGYPASGAYSPGSQLISCSGSLAMDSSNLSRTYRLPCDMNGGSSGGPWLTKFDTSGNGGTLSSVNSYTYSGLTAMHGPKFNSRTYATWSAASRTTVSVVVR